MISSKQKHMVIFLDLSCWLFFCPAVTWFNVPFLKCNLAQFIILVNFQILQMFGQTASNSVFDRLFHVSCDVHRHLKVKLWSGREKRTDTFFPWAASHPSLQINKNKWNQIPIRHKKVRYRIIILYSGKSKQQLYSDVSLKNQHIFSVGHCQEHHFNNIIIGHKNVSCPLPSREIYRL